MMKKILFALSFIFASALFASEISLQASQLTIRHGWEREGAAIRGTAAGGIAEMTFTVQQQGDFNFFIKTKNFGENWRIAEVFVNGRSIGIFGDQYGIGQKKPGWGWSRAAKTVRLQAGSNTLKIVSTRLMCRIETLLFSDNREFIPTALSNAGSTVDNQLITDPGHLPISKKLDGMFPRPKGKKGGPEILMIGGKRPWMSNTLAAELCKAGANLYLINGIYMGGMSGASIKITPQDPVEPVPLNYLPYEFNQLKRYRVVLISALSQENQTRILRDGRLEQLKKYVQDGGNLLLTINVPEILEAMAPVDLGAVKPPRKELVIQRPADAHYAALPPQWNCVDPYRIAKPKAGAQVITWLTDDHGQKEAVYAAIWKYGKGNVLFFNNDYDRRNQNIQFFTWAHRYTLMKALLSHAGGFTLEPPAPPAPQVTPVTIEKAEAALAMPELSLTRDVDAQVTLRDDMALFSNGCRIRIGKEAVDIFYPGIEQPVLKDVAFPQITYPKAATKTEDTSTGEATNAVTSSISANLQLRVKRITGGKSLVISLENADGTVALDWEFLSGNAAVDGRRLRGLGEQTTVRSLNGRLMHALKLNYSVDLDNRRFRRFACYQAPRGYVEYDLTGKEKTVIKPWGFFSDGQPFTWVEGQKGVLCEFTDDIFPVNFMAHAEKGKHILDHTMTLLFGRLKAPQKSAILWHFVMDPRYNSNNDWMAVYQFLRHIYRVKNGIPEIPARPTASYANTATADEIDGVLRAAREFGISIMYLPFCPLQIEDFTLPKSLSAMQRVKDAGLIAYPWHPCCHTPGESPLVRQHPQWFIKDETGKIAGYFGGHYRTADMDNPEFRRWYRHVIDTMMNHGTGVCWYDMGGSASGTYNFGTPESRMGLWPQMEIYKYYYQRGGFVVTEGMNPAVLDGYIFRSAVYNQPLRGREFPYIGASSVNDYMYLDFFRTSMYDFFITISLDSWENKFESTIGQLAFLQRVKGYLPAINQALENGMPFIRETPFGTTWISEKGATLFCFNGVSHLTLSLPEGYRPVSMTGPDGRMIPLSGEMPHAVPPETIINFKHSPPQTTR